MWGSIGFPVDEFGGGQDRGSEASAGVAAELPVVRQPRVGGLDDPVPARAGVGWRAPFLFDQR